MRLSWVIAASTLLLSVLFAEIGAFTMKFQLGQILADQGTDAQTQVSQIVHPERSRPETFLDLVQSTSYHAEEHDITTDDGYILTVHRMPGGPRSPVSSNKPVVLCIHGLLAASDVWVLRGPDKDLVYLMVDAGYDVWLMNMRGNYYARRHKKMVPKDDKFWRFSWHESGIHDTSSVIDHIISVTGVEKVSLIGHSMGTTIGLVLLSEKPEYNAKVNMMLSFAPIAIFTHLLPGPVNTIIVRYGRQLQKTFKTLGVNEIFPRDPRLLSMYSTLCQMPHIELLCQTLMLHIAGLLKMNQFDVIDINIVPKVLRHYPQGTSVETILHYRQLMLSGKFRQYDFGPNGNYIRYKNATPPEYDLNKVTTPTVLYYGMNDAFTTKEDVLALLAKLPNAEGRAVKHERFGHLDFLVSNFAKAEVYDDVIRTLDQYHEEKRCTDSVPCLNQAIEHLRLAPTTVIV